MKNLLLDAPLFALKKKEKKKILMKKESYSEKSRRREHDVKNDRLRFFHIGLTQGGLATEKPRLFFKGSCSSALSEDFLFLVLDVRHFKQACSIYLDWKRL